MSESKSLDVTEDLDEGMSENDMPMEEEESLSPISNIQDVKFYHVLAQIESLKKVDMELTISLNNLMRALSKKMDRA